MVDVPKFPDQSEIEDILNSERQKGTQSQYNVQPLANAPGKGAKASFLEALCNGIGVGAICAATMAVGGAGSMVLVGAAAYLSGDLDASQIDDWKNGSLYLVSLFTAAAALAGFGDGYSDARQKGLFLDGLYIRKRKGSTRT